MASSLTFSSYSLSSPTPLPPVNLKLPFQPIYSLNGRPSWTTLYVSSSNGGGTLVRGPRNWSGSERSIKRSSYVMDDDGGTDDDDDGSDYEDENDRSLDLLVRFVQNVFRKVSRKARKAARSVLPGSISTKLVGFSVNGVIILAFLWILKAFLEVVCTLGSLVFVIILLIRGVWSGLSYLQEYRNQEANVFGNNHGSWTGAQPVS